MLHGIHGNNYTVALGIHGITLCSSRSLKFLLVSPQGHADIVRMLAGVSSLEAVDDYSITPLFLAAQYGHSQCVEMLAGAGTLFGLYGNTHRSHRALRLSGFYTHPFIIHLHIQDRKVVTLYDATNKLKEIPVHEMQKLRKEEEKKEE